MRNLKKALALVLAMAMSLSLAVTAGAAYTDGDKISPEYEVAVEVASQLGILEGFENGSYGPQKNLTRAQLATMTYRLATADVDDVYTANFAGGAADAFTDTAADAWYAGYVGYAADAGFLKGCGEGLYKPNSALTGYQALAAFLRVIGYNEPGQFTGSDWTVQVAQIATQNGFLKGIENVDLAAPITREVAAQIIYNALFAQVVTYTPAFGYQLSIMKNPIADDLFGIETGKPGVIEATAPWGQPATVWNDEDGDAVVTIMEKPVAEYTEAVTECDLAKDLGLKEDGDVIAEFLNGADENVVDGDITLVDTKTEIGDQGTLVEVYEIDGEYWFVAIETWLGQIVDTTDAKYDKNGHEKAPATADLKVFETTDYIVNDLETDEFDKDEYVLVNISYFDRETEYFLTSTAPVATAEQTKIDVNKEVSTIGGTEYNWAAHYHYGFMGLVKTEYEVFVDFYGNVIGIQLPAPADPVYTILESGIYVTNGYTPYTAGKIVTETGALEDIVICDYDQVQFWADRAVTYVHDIVSYVECDDGYEMVQAGTEYDGYSIVKGTPRIVTEGKTFVTDAYTVYYVETECGVYDVYTGYANVPTMSSSDEIEILDEDNDGYIDMVYVDATNALFAGEEYFAYVMPSTESVAVGNLANDEVYKTFNDVVIDGEVVEVNCVPGFDLTAYKGLAVTLKTDVDGLVYEAVPATDFIYSGEIYAENSDEVIYVTNDGVEKSYVVTDETTIWIINLPDATVEVGTADDVDPGYRISYTLDGVNADFIILFDDVSADA